MQSSGCFSGCCCGVCARRFNGDAARPSVDCRRVGDGAGDEPCDATAFKPAVTKVCLAESPPTSPNRVVLSGNPRYESAKGVALPLPDLALPGLALDGGSSVTADPQRASQREDSRAADVICTAGTRAARADLSELVGLARPGGKELGRELAPGDALRSPLAPHCGDGVRCLCLLSGPTLCCWPPPPVGPGLGVLLAMAEPAAAVDGTLCCLAAAAGADPGAAAKPCCRRAPCDGTLGGAWVGRLAPADRGAAFAGPCPPAPPLPRPPCGKHRISVQTYAGTILPPCCEQLASS